MRNFITIFLLGIIFPIGSYADIVFQRNRNINVSINSNESEVVQTALEIFSKDYKNVFGGNVIKNKNGQILIGTLNNNSSIEKIIDKRLIDELKSHREGFVIQVKNDKIYILGSDKRGTAYGILELSRMIGVSPWEWWADSTPSKKESFTLKNEYNRIEYPSVAHRGIFINDEDWGFTPWSYKTYEPSDVKGQIGPKTHARIFELLLRLRANTFWPAMHECSVAFYMTPGNKETAKKYGIFIGTSHCEPMARNTNAEWKIAGVGKYDYVNNRENVLNFWEERAKELAGFDNIYTLGIRGVHDSKMLGANTLNEQKIALINILKDQREIIAKYINQNVEEVPQVFIPYKEVQDVYNMGLEVPEDVTLMWCDDNYGYIRHFPDAKERSRKGGNGVYYHISYWGRPHDYLWLTTNHPAQLYTQMKMAYDKGAKDLWILNVGDIKPAEYLIELFMDMAWNIESIESNVIGLDNHLYSWMSREFGVENAKELLSVMNEFYRLSYIRKPEFMGNTRTEEKDPEYKIIKDLPWSEVEIKQRIKDYQIIEDKVINLSKRIPANKQCAWFQLVEYPVRGAAEMNKKHLYGELARHGLAEWKNSDDAFDTIVSLTQKYNSLNNGKWKNIMDYKPRNLPVYEKVPQLKSENPLIEHKPPLHLFNGTEYNSFIGKAPVSYGLGYKREAISLPKGSVVCYSFTVEKFIPVQIEVTLAPNHPVEGKTLRYSIQVDNEPIQIVDFKTEGRNEEWKENVLRNQAIRTTNHSLVKNNNPTIKITALDEGVIIDQIKVWGKR